MSCRCSLPLNVYTVKGMTHCSLVNEKLQVSAKCCGITGTKCVMYCYRNILNLDNIVIYLSRIT